MIITVTMNPAIDKTLDVENFTGGSVHRVTKVIQDAGGKGINVSKAVQALGGETIAAGFLGGTAGRMIEHALDDLSIRHEFVHIDGETRTNIKVVDTAREGFVTEFNEPGPVVTPRNIDALAERLEELAGPSAIFVFSGSIPAAPQKAAGKTGLDVFLVNAFLHQVRLRVGQFVELLRIGAVIAEHPGICRLFHNMDVLGI